jgi:hypothetical protein
MSGPTWRKGRQNWAEVALGQSAQSGRPTPFLRQFGPPFLEREDASTLSHCGRRYSERTELYTREVVHKAERLDRDRIEEIIRE